VRRTNRLSDTDGELWAQPSVDDFGLDLFGVGEAATSGLGLAGGCTYIPPHRRRRPRTCTQPDTLRVRGGDNGIDRNKKRLRFTYNFMFSRSHDLPPHPYARRGGADCLPAPVVCAGKIAKMAATPDEEGLYKFAFASSADRQAWLKAFQVMTTDDADGHTDAPAAAADAVALTMLRACACRGKGWASTST
jgi:hypothetical protein